MRDPLNYPPGCFTKSLEAMLEAEGMPAELPFEFEQHNCISDALDKAGVDDGTDAATFIEMNGRNIFITGEDLTNA